MTLLLHLAIALGLGLLIGLEREWSTDEIAGIRTFPLIAVFGVLCAKLGETFGGWMIAAGLLGLAVVLVLGDLAKFNLARLPEGETGARRIDPGVTTEVSALLTFVLGAALAQGLVTEAVVTGGGMAALLHWKKPLHGFVETIGEGDVKAIIRLILIALVIAPILPNKSFGPYDVINPFEIWLMVVLIEGITLGAYVVSRLLGTRTGTILAGGLGGMISSTATSASYARRTRDAPDETPIAAVVVIIASTVVFVRVGIELAVVAPETLQVAGPPLATMMLWMACVSLAALFFLRGGGGDPLEERHDPPSELGTAIIFGLLYALVLLGVAAAKEHLGEGALYAVAVLSGLTDMDAITLSTAQMIQSDRLEAGFGWRLILVGAMANLVFKSVIVAMLGHRRLAGRVAVLFTLSLAGGVAILLLWP